MWFVIAQRQKCNTTPCSKQAIGENSCGIFGLEGCLFKKRKRIVYLLHLIAHIIMQQWTIKLQQNSPRQFHAPMSQCTVHCAPLLSLGNHKPYGNIMLCITWSMSIPFSPIPGQLLVHIFITKEGERVLGIQKQVTTGWRRQDNIPDSDGFEVYLQLEGPQRNRSDETNRKKTQARCIQEYIAFY